MDNLPRLRLQCVPIGPVGSTGRRVEGFEGDSDGATTQKGLFHISDGFRAVKLIQLLEVDIGHISEGQLYGLQVAWIIQTKEHDFLTRGQIGQLHGADRGLPLLPHAQLIQRPKILVIDRPTQGVILASEDYRMGVWVLQHLGLYLLGDPGGLGPATPSLTQSLADGSSLDLAVEVKKGGGHDLRQPICHRQW